MKTQQIDNPSPKLKRSLNLPLLVLYGLGTTIGAGIYVLVGAAAGRAGIFAPFAFLIAAIAIAPTALSYGELAGRFPISSGEAAYVEGGFRSKWLSGFVGWLVIISGIVASATIAIGCAGYLSTFFDIKFEFIVVIVVLLVGLVACWGIVESVVIASIFTLIEVGGLLMLIFAWFFASNEVTSTVVISAPPIADFAIWIGIANAALLAVFAFIGFEDMVNVAEETKDPGKTMPKAIMLTLAITSVLYFLVTWVAVHAVSTDELANSSAPLGLVFSKLTNMSPATISIIAVFATANTILVQFIMASRVIYGMSKQKTMPSIFGRINRRTKTPLIATFVVIALTALLALTFELNNLADITSLFVLVIWMFANIALVLIKLRKEETPSGIFIVPIWVPLIGVLFSTLLVIVSISQI